MTKSQIVALILIVVLSCAVINWVRAGDSGWHIIQSLPLLGGYQPGIYDLAGAAMLLIMAWGLKRLQRRERK